MKKYLFLVCMIISAFTANAEFNRLIFLTADGKEQSIGLTDLNIKFSGGEMIATSEGEAIKISLNSLKSMEFANGLSGIEVISTTNGLEGNIKVYSMEGQYYGIYENAIRAGVELPEGWYIFKDENGLTSKILINR